MATAPVIILDDSLEPVADLGDATNVGYKLQHNQVSTASFDLPTDDPHLGDFEGRYFARIYDGDKDLGLFRINRKDEENQGDEAVVSFTCKHALDTLNDDRIQDPVTKTGATTALEYILNQQETARWQLGDMEFSKSGLEYEFERQTLLDAILQVTAPWWEEFDLEFDFSTSPWTLHVRQPDTESQATLQYDKNLEDINRTVDYEEVITKLWAYGAGSGVDQVTAGPFESDPTGLGVIEGEFSESYFDNATDLEDAALKYLDMVDTPRVEYNGAAADFYRKFRTNDINLGDYVTVYDAKLGIDIKAKVVEKRKSSVLGSPGQMQLSLDNKPRTKPDWGALAYKDQADERDLASSSVRGGAGGALASGAVGSSELGADSVDEEKLAEEAVVWNTIAFKDTSGAYLEQTRLKIDAFVTFESDFTNLDKLKDGTTYAKMRKEWRSADDQTMFDGGYIYTNTVTLDSIQFSPVLEDDVVGSINASTEGIDIEGENIQLNGNTTVEGTFTVSQGNVVVDQDIDMGAGTGWNKIIGCETIEGDASIGLVGNINLSGATYMGAGYKFYLDAGQGMDTQGGPIAMGGGNINSPGTVDGVDVSAHAGNSSAHHDPFTQVDAILTAGSNIVLTSDSSAGTIEIAGSGIPSALGDLSDVSLSSLTSGDALKYDGTEWVNGGFAHGDLSGIGSTDHHDPSALLWGDLGIAKSDIALGDLGNVYDSLSPFSDDVLYWTGSQWRANDIPTITGWSEDSDPIVNDIGFAGSGTWYSVQTENNGYVGAYLVDFVSKGDIYYVSY